MKVPDGGQTIIDGRNSHWVKRAMGGHWYSSMR